MLKSIWQGIRRGWAVWTRIAHKIGNFQARVLLTLMYAILVLPFGVIVRLFADPLHIKKRPEAWLDHSNEACDLEWARRQ
jgi:hypothetical protein